jgi:hypothetical protein
MLIAMIGSGDVGSAPASALAAGATAHGSNEGNA